MLKNKEIKIIIFMVLQCFMFTGICQAAKEVIEDNCLAPLLHLNSQNLQNAMALKQLETYSADEALLLPADRWVNMVAERLSSNDILSLFKMYQLYEVKPGNPRYEQSFNANFPKFYKRILDEYDLAITTTRLEQVKNWGGIEKLVKQSEESAKIKFKALQGLSIFKQELSNILISYHQEAGAEDGMMFTKSGQSVKFEKHTFTSLIRTNEESAICSVHTHCAAFAGVSKSFFTPSAKDIILGFCSGDENVGILWGTIQRGFYLTVVNAKRVEIPFIIHSFVRNGNFDFDGAQSALDAWVENSMTTFQYYRLNGEGEADENGIFREYSLSETGFPEEEMNYYYENSSLTSEQLINDYKKMQRKKLVKKIDKMGIRDAALVILKSTKEVAAYKKKSFDQMVEATAKGDRVGKEISSLEHCKFGAHHDILMDLSSEVATAITSINQRSLSKGAYIEDSI